jgi:hypothetical protein
MDKFDVMDVNQKQREKIDFLESRIEWLETLQSQVLYVVEMLRWGDREKHSYVIGVFSNEWQAKQCGEIEKSWRGGKYEYEVKTIALNDWGDEDDKKYENHEQCRPRSFTYSTNWMGPVATSWYEVRDIPFVMKETSGKHLPKFEYKEFLESYSCGRIDIRGDTESPHGDEYGVRPMRTEDWNAFSDWLDDLDTTYQWTYQELLEGFEKETQTTIRWEPGAPELVLGDDK